MPGGPYDSSLTRVQPVFRQLHRLDPTGVSWLGRLLASGSRARDLGVAGREASWTGQLTRPPIFEYQAEAPVDYLRCLVQRPDRILDATQADTSLLSELSPAAAKRRRQLAEGDAEVVAEALRKLSAGRAGRYWWVLEGPTSVDCVLMAEQVTVFIEGKRTEPHLTGGTTWDRHRHQVFRNLDCLRAMPGRAAQYYVLLLVEEHSPAMAEARELDGAYPVARDSWPHLDNRQAEGLFSRYLGYATWQQIAGGLRLPKTTDEARRLGLTGPCEEAG